MSELVPEETLKATLRAIYTQGRLSHTADGFVEMVVEGLLRSFAVELLTVPCETCGGTGWVVFTEGPGPDYADDCPDCGQHGAPKGRVSIVEKAKVKATAETTARMTVARAQSVCEQFPSEAEMYDELRSKLTEEGGNDATP